MSGERGHKRSVAANVVRAIACAALVAGIGIIGFLGFTEAKASAVAASPEGGAAEPEGVTDPWGFEQVDWDWWEAENADMIGWLQVPGTDISQPVMAATEDAPTYYLNHGYDGERTYVGAPFLDATCEGDFDSGCAPIYGHHLTSGRMFSPLENMTDKDWAADHATVLLQTRDWKRVYSVSTARIVNAAKADVVCRYENKQQLASWLQDEAGRADVVLEEPACTPVIQLVTCSYSTYRNERTVVTCQVAHEFPPDWQGYAEDQR